MTNDKQAPAEIDLTPGDYQVVPVDDKPEVAMMQIIATASANPNTDIEKMKSLIEMKKDMDQYDANKEYWKALAKMQPKLPIVEKLGTGHNSKYAKFEDVIEAISPILSKHGFSLTFKHTNLEGGMILTTGRLAHKDGHIEEDQFAIPPDTSGNKSPIHAVGSARSYGKRYTTGSLLGLAFRDEDDDGQSATTPAQEKPAPVSQAPATGKLATEKQVGLMKAKLSDKAPGFEERLLETIGVNKVEDIPMGRVNEALDIIQAN